MSTALWCDIGGHPFSALDPGWQSMSVSINVKRSDGQMGQQTEKRDVCGEHALSSLTRQLTTGPEYGTEQNKE